MHFTLLEILNQMQQGCLRNNQQQQHIFNLYLIIIQLKVELKNQSKTQTFGMFEIF